MSCYFDQLLLAVVQAKMRFVELVYVLVTEEAERIGVDHVARVSAGDSTEGSMGNMIVIFNCWLLASLCSSWNQEAEKVIEKLYVKTDLLGRNINSNFFLFYFTMHFPFYKVVKQANE